MDRETWTDERLDDLNARVSDGFREQHEDTRALGTELRAEIKAVEESVRTELKAVDSGLRTEIKAVEKSLRAEIKAVDEGLRTEMQAGFAQINQRFDRLQVMIIGSLLTLAIALVVERI